jgi:hypothetical protein
MTDETKVILALAALCGASFLCGTSMGYLIRRMHLKLLAARG